MNNEKDPLLEVQKSLIVQDHNNYFNNYTRINTSIDNLRQWQITILSALIALVFSQKEPTNLRPLIAVLGIMLLGFMFIEAIHRTNLIISGTLSAKLESLIKSSQSFQELIQNHNFGNEVSIKRDYKSKIRFLKRVIVAPSFFFWYLLLFFLLAIINFAFLKS